MRKYLLRHNFIWVVLLIIFIPGILAILMHFFGPTIILKWMSSDYRLGGMTTKIKEPSVDLTHFKSHAVQKYLEEALSNQLPLRSLLIRTNNQIYYSLFNKSYAYSGQIVVGKENQLFELPYIHAYCGLKKEASFRDSTNLVKWADKIKILSDYFENRGKVFVYVITPSKAEYMPKALPDRYHCNNVGISPHLQTFEKLLAERKIRFINSSRLMQAAANQFGVSMFPQGGTHWNMLGAAVTTNAIIDTLNRSKQIHLQPIKFKYVLSNDPKGSDRDLLNVLNLVRVNDHYAVPKLHFLNIQPQKPTKAAFIGGSFVGHLIDVFKLNKTFSNMSYYYYFKLEESDYELDKKPIKHKVNLKSAQALDKIIAADVIILEENSAIIASNHGSLFFDTMSKYVM